ncbi:MAG: hypothetical protein GX440_03125 [Propionibacterium sp.]|nr:hypothetical protein [Propionibacterium sp.]
MKVAITVKTYPSPSTEYLETVCVAGVRLDTEKPEWVRLYPVPFRFLRDDQRFIKYEVIELDANTHVRDKRPESRRPVLDSIRTVGHLLPDHGWVQRSQAFGSLVGATTACDLRAGVERNKGSAPSLGCIRPADVGKVYIKPPEPWTETMIRNAERATEGDLFRQGIRQLEQPPFDIRFTYRCESKRCPGHDQKTLDWEAQWSAIRWTRDKGQEEAERLAIKKWSSMVSSDKDAAFFLGNQHQHPGSFSILGNWYPKKGPETLF